MPQLSSPPEAANRSTIRRRIERFMVMGGLLGWGVVACVVAGAVSEPGTWPATFWFITAFGVMLVMLRFLIKGYRLEDKHNPNFNPQGRAHGVPESQPTVRMTSASGEDPTARPTEKIGNK